MAFNSRPGAVNFHVISGSASSPLSVISVDVARAAMLAVLGPELYTFSSAEPTVHRVAIYGFMRAELRASLLIVLPHSC